MQEGRGNAVLLRFYAFDCQEVLRDLREFFFVFFVVTSFALANGVSP